MKNIYIIIFTTLFFSCANDEPKPEIHSNFQNGVFVLNEGNYTWSNASVSFIDLDSGKVHNNLFINANQKSLGDVAQSMYAIDSLLFIIVNNSSKMEVVSINNFKSVATIHGLLSPRYMIKVSDDKAFISDLYSKYLKVLNYKTFEIIDSVYLGKSSENLLKFYDKVFVTNWSKLGMSEIENNTIQVIDVTTLEILETITVNREPCGMQLDMHENLWVLCSGSFLNSDAPAIYKIDPVSYSVLQKIDFPMNNSPKHLLINNAKDSLYFINTHLYCLSVSVNQLPNDPFIHAENVNFYNAGISPFSGNIFITDVKDYVQNGYVYQFSSAGIPIDTFEVKITPSEMLFVNTD